MITHLIGGRQVESREVFETVNPANQDVLAEVAAAVAAAKTAYPDGASRG
jgi:5-carboxymethyl-2-hydroxymuconic-semialdehyde dehydrogenase